MVKEDRDPTTSTLGRSTLAPVQEAACWLQAAVKTEEAVHGTLPASAVQDAEELWYSLLLSLPRSRLATLQRRIAPLLDFDIIGHLPTELALQIFSYLPYEGLLVCGIVNRRWRALANEQNIWKALCRIRGWVWNYASNSDLPRQDTEDCDSNDEGMGDSENELIRVVERSETTEADSALPFSSVSLPPTRSRAHFGVSKEGPSGYRDAHPSFPCSSLFSMNNPSEQTCSSPFVKPNYKLLYQTHMKLNNRFLASSYRLSVLQTRGAANGHTNTIYCLQLYTYPLTGVQVLFTGSRDRTLREWNLKTGKVEHVISGVHVGSVLSLCAHRGYLASAGSDGRVGVWNLGTHRVVKVISDHEDSVLCVRFDETKLASCSKDRTVRIYSFPDLQFKFALNAHRAAVNAVSIHGPFIVSASGDRSIILWDAETGEALRTFAQHHTRGIATVDFIPPTVLTGSSDKHVRLFDMSTLQGWATSPNCDSPTPDPFLFGSSSGGPASSNPDSSPSIAFSASTDSDVSSSSFSTSTSRTVVVPGLVCQTCGSDLVASSAASSSSPSAMNRVQARIRTAHRDLVRTVALGQEFALSGSYDASIKIWDRKTGGLVTELTGGHTGRIFCLGLDSKKIISCGEDQRICIWDFSYGVNTRFIA